ncbi:hypothetical protein I7I53_09495 [Histoplasma capsulatum var. duboisii H88]|uniref:Uncharacterized protein n=1 Tax=Ajellomyces capsulatus (strain H88) TaxID=544711 RepID=A0A8A1LAX3_AJEC8|nr:hypothetical protein I7I53_09495 [Histoplasma capsulatum var. duboisii H88]
MFNTMAMKQRKNGFQAAGASFYAAWLTSAINNPASRTSFFYHLNVKRLNGNVREIPDHQGVMNHADPIVKYTQGILENCGIEIEMENKSGLGTV